MAVCECTHIQGDHRSATQGLHPRVYGVCMVEGCDCVLYREAIPDEAERRRLRQLEREGRSA